MRNFSRRRLLEEIKCFVEKDVRLLTILDPLFNADKTTYMQVLRDLHDAGYNGKLSLQCHFSYLNAEFLELVREFDVCLEFGLQSVIPCEGKAIGRTNNMKKVGEFMVELTRQGIYYKVDLIYGLPAQTLDSFRSSVKFCREHGVPVLRCWPLMLLRGTKLATVEEREKWGFRENNGTPPVVVSSNSFSEKDWERMRTLSDELAREYDPVHKRWADAHFRGNQHD